MTQLLTVAEAAKLLALSRSTLYSLMEQSDLAYARIGRARRIPADEIEHLVRESLVGSRNVVAS